MEEQRMARKCEQRDFPAGPVVKTLASKAGGVGLIPGRGAKILHVWKPKKKQKKNQKTKTIKQKQYCNKFNKDFKNRPHQKREKGNETVD